MPGKHIVITGFLVIGKLTVWNELFFEAYFIRTSHTRKSENTQRQKYTNIYSVFEMWLHFLKFPMFLQWLFMPYYCLVKTNSLRQMTYIVFELCFNKLRSKANIKHIEKIHIDKIYMSACTFVLELNTNCNTSKLKQAFILGIFVNNG